MITEAAQFFAPLLLSNINYFLAGVFIAAGLAGALAAGVFTGAAGFAGWALIGSVLTATVDGFATGVAFFAGATLAGLSLVRLANFLAKFLAAFSIDFSAFFKPGPTSPITAFIWAAILSLKSFFKAFLAFFTVALVLVFFILIYRWDLGLWILLLQI